MADAGGGIINFGPTTLITRSCRATNPLRRRRHHEPRHRHITNRRCRVIRPAATAALSPTTAARRRCSPMPPSRATSPRVVAAAFSTRARRRSPTPPWSATRPTFGGGIYTVQHPPSTLTLTNSTVSGNLAGYTGGGIQSSNFNAATTLINSIVAGNKRSCMARFDGHDVQPAGTLTLTGGNIVGDTRTIDGATQQTGIALTDIFASVTNAPTPTSSPARSPPTADRCRPSRSTRAASNPAIDAGDDALAPATRRRGFSRDDVAGAANNGANVSDLGAFESGDAFRSRHHARRRSLRRRRLLCRNTGWPPLAARSAWARQR